MRYYILLLTFLSLQLKLSAQEFCQPDTSHTFKMGHREVEEHAKLRALMRVSGEKDIVPLRVHVVLQELPDRNRDVIHIEQLIKEMNDQYAHIDLEFQMCGEVNFISSNKLYMLDSFDEHWELVLPYNDPRTVDLFIVGRINFMSACGYASLGWNGDGFLVIQESCFDIKVLLHEMGHYFNLPHTHETMLGNELVDGSNCNRAGDMVCDTPADPNLSGKVSFATCQYNGDLTDESGQRYTPLTDNHMSYAPGNCRSRFTEMQYQRMRYYYDVIASKMLACSDMPDLEVQLLLSDFRMVKGSSNRVSFTIANRSGTKYSGPLDYGISLLDIYGRTHPLKNVTLNKDFLLYKTDTIIESVVVPEDLAYGIYKLVVELDPEQRIEEISKANNTAIREIGIYDQSVKLPDLIFTYTAEFPHYAGTNLRIHATVTNVGNEIARDFNIAFFISDDTIPDHSDITKFPNHVNQLAPGASYNVQYNVPLPKDNSQPWYVLLLVDPENKIKEISETNNLTIIEVQSITPPDDIVRPDFVITSHKFANNTPTSLKVLQRSHLLFTVENIGQGPASISNTGVYISKDDRLSDDDIYIYSTLEEFAQFRIPLGLETGNYFIILKADHLDLISESNERNNTYAIPMHIENDATPDLAMIAYDLSSRYWTYTEPFSFKAIFENVGTAIAQNWQFNFYIQKQRYTYARWDFYAGIRHSFYASEWRLPVLPGATESFDYTALPNPDLEEGEYYLAACIMTTGNDFRDWEFNNCIVLDEPILLTRDILTSKEARTEEASSRLYPNPASERFHIIGDGHYEEVVVCSLEGVELMRFGHGDELKVSSLTSGLYLVNIKTNNEVFTQKLIINR